MRRFLASAFGVGLLPRRFLGRDGGAGTLGALVAIPISVAARPFGVGTEIAAAVVVTGLGLWAARPFARDGADPGWVAIDETAGTLVAVIGLGGWPWAIAFLVARVADISKALPGVSAAESLPGEVGVMADDLVAGAYGLAAGWLAALAGL